MEFIAFITGWVLGVGFGWYLNAGTKEPERPFVKPHDNFLTRLGPEEHQLNERGSPPHYSVIIDDAPMKPPSPRDGWWFRFIT